MPDLKISGLTDATVVNDADELPIVQGGVTKRATKAELLASHATTAALTAHEADTTSVHGITDTSALYRAGGTDVAIADGGTGASTAATAVANLGAVPAAQSVNAQTGTTYTLVAGDAGLLVTLSNAGAITLTVPQDTDATIAVGTYVDLYQLGAGQVTVAAGTGATLRVSGLTAKARAQYSRLGVQKVSANTWSLFGDLAAS